MSPISQHSELKIVPGNADELPLGVENNEQPTNTPLNEVIVAVDEDTYSDNEEDRTREGRIYIARGEVIDAFKPSKLRPLTVIRSKNVARINQEPLKRELTPAEIEDIGSRMEKARRYFDDAA